MPLQPGTLVRDGLRLVRELGAGAMGSVWVAQHEQLGTEVAVKFIHRDLDRDGGVVRARFEREAKAAAQIISPHAVKVLDAGFMPETGPFIVMEKLDGVSLGEHIGRVGHLSLRDTAEVVAQVSQALQEAHGRGIVHRDIKPDNIFLVRGQHRIYAKVLDFGLAKSEKWSGSGKLTNPEDMVGTPAYLSRETILAQPVDHQADLWALGVVAYECLTGQMPFDGASMALICVAICDGKYTPASAIVPELPPSVDAFFARAFSLLPADRFASAQDMAIALLHSASPEEIDRHNAQQAMLRSGPFELPPPSRHISGDYTTLALEHYDQPLAMPAEARKRRARSVTGVAVAGTVVALGLAAMVGLQVAREDEPLPKPMVLPEPGAAIEPEAEPAPVPEGDRAHEDVMDPAQTKPAAKPTAQRKAETGDEAGPREGASARPAVTAPPRPRNPSGNYGTAEAEHELGF